MESSFDISTDDRERIIARAEQDKAFAAVGRVLSELVDVTGLPEDEIANALLRSDELILLFRLYRTAADVTRRLSGEPPKERLTEEEWKVKELQKENEIARARHAEMMRNMSALQAGRLGAIGGSIGGMANIIPSWRAPSSPPEEFGQAIADGVIQQGSGWDKPKLSGWKDQMSEYVDRLMK